MDLLDQAELLREELKRRITAKEITGTQIARRMGITQGVVSTFLSGKKKFSLKRLNLLLHAMDLTVEQLIVNQTAVKRPAAKQRDDGSPASAATEIRFVPVVNAKRAIEERVIVFDTKPPVIGIPYAIAEADAAINFTVRLGWDRFVAVPATRAHALFMRGIIEEGSTLIIDRYVHHHDPKAPTTIYAISDNIFLRIGYLRFIARQFWLLSNDSFVPAIPITLGPRQDDPHIVGTISTIVHHRKRSAAKLDSS